MPLLIVFKQYLRFIYKDIELFIAIFICYSSLYMKKVWKVYFSNLYILFFLSFTFASRNALACYLMVGYPCIFWRLESFEKCDFNPHELQFITIIKLHHDLHKNICMLGALHLGFASRCSLSQIAILAIIVSLHTFLVAVQ